MQVNEVVGFIVDRPPMTGKNVSAELGRARSFISVTKRGAAYRH